MPNNVVVVHGGRRGRVMSTRRSRQQTGVLKLELLGAGMGVEHTRMHSGNAEQQHQYAEHPDYPGCAMPLVLVDHAASIEPTAPYGRPDNRRESTG